MKKILIIILSFLSVSAFAIQDDGEVKIIATSNDIFYFKVDKELLGAEVEIIASDGEMLGSQKISKKRTLIDFYNLAPGSYTIIILKDEIQKEFHYVKK